MTSKGCKRKTFPMAYVSPRIGNEIVSEIGIKIKKVPIECSRILKIGGEDAERKALKLGYAAAK